jgi:hypothetical protein
MRDKRRQRVPTNCDGSSGAVKIGRRRWDGLDEDSRSKRSYRSPPTSNGGASATSSTSSVPEALPHKVGRAVGRVPERVGRVSKKPATPERRGPYFQLLIL